MAVPLKRFALSLKTPGKLLPGKTRKEFTSEVMQLLLSLLGIPHTRNTMVGSPFVRGVSGGERKRVSIAEMYGVAFFSFYLVVASGFLSLAGFFRLLGTLCQNYDQASRLASFVVTIMILYSGYLIPMFSQYRWLVLYLTPLNFAFSAAMENEFKRIDLACVGSYITPNSLSGALRQ